MVNIVGWSSIVDWSSESWGSSVCDYWSLNFYWFDLFDLNFDRLDSWESIVDNWGSSVVNGWGSDSNWGNSMTNRINKSILVNIFGESFEVDWTDTTWGENSITPCWGQRSSWKSRLEELRVGCWSSISHGGYGQDDKCLHVD
jgi:hypothetical protein